MVPPDVFNLLAMGRVMRESRISTGDAAMDEARRRTKGAKGNMTDRRNEGQYQILWPIIYVLIYWAYLESQNTVDMT
jgi:hypothetical protein